MSEVVFRVPPALAFSFVQNVMLRQKPPIDQALQLLSGCDALADVLLSLMGASGPTTRTTTEEKSEESGGWFSFPIERTIIRHTRGAATYTVWLERMYNGHLGCNEDKLWFELCAGDKRVRGDAYLFVGDAFKMHFDNVDAQPIAATIQNALGLI